MNMTQKRIKLLKLFFRIVYLKTARLWDKICILRIKFVIWYHRKLLEINYFLMARSYNFNALDLVQDLAADGWEARRTIDPRDGGNHTYYCHVINDKETKMVVVAKNNIIKSIISPDAGVQVDFGQSGEQVV